MCITIEQVKTAVREVWEEEHQPEMFRAIDQKFVAFLPTAIAKGIMEAEKHMKMSPDTEKFRDETRNEFQKVYKLFDKINASIDINTKFHEDVRPVLEFIKEDMEGRKYVSNKIKAWSGVVAGISIIIGSLIAFIKYVTK